MASVVQVAKAFSNPTANPLTATFPANTTAGNTLAAIFATGTTNTLSPDSADTWTQEASSPYTVNGSHTACWYVLSCVGGKMSYSFNRTNTGNCTLIILEISGVTALDVSAAGTPASNTATATTGTGNTANANDLLVALFATNQTYSPGDSDYDSTTLTAGWTWEGSSTPSTGTGANNHNSCVGAAVRSVSSTGSYSASVNTLSSTAVSGTFGVVLAFKASAGAVDPFPAGYQATDYLLPNAVYRI